MEQRKLVLCIAVLLSAIETGADSWVYGAADQTSDEVSQAAANPTTGSRWEGGCPALFQGPQCDQVKELPACLDGPYKGWFTLNGNSIGSGYKPKPKGKKRNAKSVSGADLWYSGVDIDPKYVEQLPPRDVFGSLQGAAPSCALVSNGAILKKRSWGAKIDEHNVVVRLNNAPTLGFEKQVGSKTSLRYTNSAYQGFREVDQEAVLAKFCNGADKGKCGFSQELTGLLQKKVHALNPAFLEYATSTYFRSHRATPTSGMVVLLLLLHHCQEVSVFGFFAGDLKKWYFNKRAASGGKQAPKERWLREKSWTVPAWTFAEDTAAADLTVAPGGGAALAHRALGLKPPSLRAGQGRRRLAAAPQWRQGPRDAAVLAAGNRTGAAAGEAGEGPWEGGAPGRWEGGGGGGGAQRQLLLHASDWDKTCMKMLQAKGFLQMYQ